MKEGVYLPDASIGYDVNGFPIEVPFLDCETILIAPVHVPGHWNGLAIDFAKRLFVYYEPYGAYLNRESNIHVIKSWLIERDARVARVRDEREVGVDCDVDRARVAVRYGRDDA